MTSAKTDSAGLLQRPMRADARRNYDKLLDAARDAFTQDGPDATLDDIARRAGVGPGTLYRHFPTRQHLLEAVYLGEVQEMCRAADDLADLSPWDALVAWLRQYLSFAATKRAVAGELVTYIDRDAEVFRNSRAALVGAGDALVQAAQDAGALRPDTSFGEIGRLVGTIGGMSPTSGPEEIDRMFAIVLDGLRHQPARDSRN
jgi:AcrR family transcriptional regulator